MSEEQATPVAEVAEVAPASAGMFDMADGAPEVVVEDTPAALVADVSEWAWDDGIKGEGDRPDWLKGKYKSVSEQAKAYGDLEGKFGEFKGAPKDGYKLDGIEGIDPESPLLKGFQETFKDLNLSQAGFERVMSEYTASQGSLTNIDVKAEMEKLGPQAQDMVNKTNQWLKNNLPADVVSTVHSWVQTADDMKALDVLRSFQPLSSSPTANQMTPSASYESLQEVKNEKTDNWERYQEDTNYRKALTARMVSAEHRETARKRK
jgi:hypothetical protein